MKVHVLVRRDGHSFIVTGETAVVMAAALVSLDPLVLHDPKFLTPPVPFNEHTMITATTISDAPLKEMAIKQKDIVIVTQLGEDAEDEKDDSAN